MAITGTIARDGTVTLTWNLQGERLRAPGENLQYLPCEVCGVVQVVTCNTVSMTCNNCGDVHNWGFELNGKEVEDAVEFVQQLDPHDRQAVLALEPGEGMFLRSGAAPLLKLVRRAD